MLKLYDFLPSGNGYKVRLLLTQLEIPFELVEVDPIKGATRTPEFLARNPNGRVPTLEFEDGRILTESCALLCYFGEGSDFWPKDRFERAQMLQWMFFEQYSHEPCIAVARFIHHHAADDPARRAQLPSLEKRGYQALDVMEQHLTSRRFFVGERYGLADIALYAYTHVAEEGGFDLEKYPAIRAWLKRVADEPNHIPITMRPQKSTAAA